MIRTMKNAVLGVTFYRSSFNTETGMTVRVVETVKGSHWRDLCDELVDADDGERWAALRSEWESRFGWRRSVAFSPSPETIDISITDKCAFGCSYCYRDSASQKQHAPADLVTRTIKSFTTPPYQVALGGGEPTSHPDFPTILRSIKELGVVPNYTTAGNIFRDDVIAATNDVCGGVSITYHPHKGAEWFLAAYQRWAEALDRRVQLNVHVLADKDVVSALHVVRELVPVRALNVVLLAYHPDVGRGSPDRLMDKQTYHVELPKAIREIVDSGVRLAFSEGLLPYFISRPWLGVSTRFALPQEGRFSCFVDSDGCMYYSSFAPRHSDMEEPSPRSVFDGADLQALWDTADFGWVRNGPSGQMCYDCAEAFRCSWHNVHHYLTCAYAPHNRV